MTKTRVRLALAWVLLVGSLIGWPVSKLTIAKHEPPVVLGLSWLAITLTALEILLTVSVRNNQDDDES